MVAQGYINITNILSKYNIAVVLSKNWSYQSYYENLIKPLLSYHDNGSHYDTFDINKLLDVGLDFEFNIVIQDFCNSESKIGLNGSDKKRYRLACIN